jgi:hypothetical protein
LSGWVSRQSGLKTNLGWFSRLESKGLHGKHLGGRARSRYLLPVPYSLISHLSKKEQQELLDDLNYLNTAEIKAFCRKHSIPYRIAIETGEGTRRRTRDDDRKGVVLDRMRHFLKTGLVLQETCFPATVVSLDAFPQKFAASDRLFYGQYDKNNRAVFAILVDLTAGKFKDGAVARILAREFWSRSEAPTLEEYASAWLDAMRKHTRPNPEWAFLSDSADKTAGADWKTLRTRKAKKVTNILNQITKKREPSSV